jgi:sugar phosphate isomerase/epimerase
VPKDFTFGVSEFTTWPSTFEADVELYAAAGVDCIEVTEFKLDHARLADQMAVIENSGLRVSSVQATVHSLFPDGFVGEPTHPNDRTRHIRQSIERIAPYVPAGTPFIAVTGAAPGGNVQLVYESAVEAFGELAEVASAHGVRIAFEPLNPMLMNSDTAIWSLTDALQLVEAVDHPSFGLCVDLWNIWQSPNLLDTVARSADRIFLVQVSDFRRPRSHNDRVSIGDGQIPLSTLIAAVRKAAYEGPYVLEIFSSESLTDSLWRAEFVPLLQRNMAAFAKVWLESETL